MIVIADRMDKWGFFHDNEFQRDYRRDGFVKVDLLGADDVQHLLEFYNRYDKQPDAGGFYATMFHPDIEIKKKISAEICSVVERNLRRYITGFRPLFGNFIVKAGRNRHEVGIHQDWTYVDENQYRSFNVWTSLCHSGPENGGMYMLPGSHLVQMPVRWTPFDSDIYDRYRKKIKRYSVGMELEPGQAVVYDSAVIHYSEHNNTPDMRPACGCVFVPESAQPKHYFRERDKLLVYDAGNDFFNCLDPGQRPPASPSGTIPVSEYFDKQTFELLF